ncbi:hypothetical protein SY88_12030 [Clostridiales bacterium PH28_bin88]|nr:hypothetical protein SY88_12030 [Clostridiales bacterium PH28_bin88]
MAKLRSYLISGILALLPLTITLYVLQFVYNFINGLLAKHLDIPLEKLLGRYYFQGLGFIITILLILLLGALATNIVGRKAINAVETLLVRIPLVKPIYSGVKQITDAFSLENRSAFKKVALIEYPRKGIYAIGFITGENTFGDKADMISVFLPTTPNPTSGFLLFLPRESVTPLNISVEEGMKLIISGGVAKPATER